MPVHGSLVRFLGIVLGGNIVPAAAVKLCSSTLHGFTFYALRAFDIVILSELRIKEGR